jgi:hypothetical protein
VFFIFVFIRLQDFKIKTKGTDHPQGVELPLYHYCVVVAPVLLPLLPGPSPACPATIGLKQLPFLMFFLAFPTKAKILCLDSL